MKLLIVGGVAGGASAAARARRLAEDAEIIVFERGPDVSFANCGLPYYLGGEITERHQLLVVTPERLRSRYRLDVRVRTSVEALDRPAKKVRVRDLVSGQEYEESYDKLILAPGAAPVRPPIHGIDLLGIFTLRNLQDMDRIQEQLARGVRQAVVVGAGFAGLAAAVRLAGEGRKVTLVEATGKGGGRSRSFAHNDSGWELDNGQHLMMGCYFETLAFLRTIQRPAVSSHSSPLISVWKHASR